MFFIDRKNFYILFIYFISFLLFFNINSFLLFWILLELNLIIFVLIITKSSFIFFKTNLYDQCFFYFIIQSLGSILFILSLGFNIIISRYFCFILIISIILKLGIFPLQFWFFKLASYITFLPFFLILTFQKIPLFFLIFHLNLELLIIIFIVNLIVGSFFLYTSCSINKILISSSIYSTIWIFLFMIIRLFIFFHFFFNYLIFIFLISKEKIFSLYSLPYVQNKFLYTSSVLFLIGIPPFRLFFLKFYTFNWINITFSIFNVFLIWMFSFIRLIGYFNFFLKSFTTFYFLNNYYIIFNRNIYLIVFIILNSFIIFFFWSKLFKLLSSYLK